MAAPTYLYGETNPVDATVATAKAVAKGDLCGMAADTLIRAEDQAWDTDEATTRTNFTALFLGVSGQKKDAGVDTVYGNGFANQIRVATAGVWEFDCASATWAVGDRVGVAKATGNALESQKVVKVTALAEAIGRCVRSGTSLTRVRVQIISSLVPLAE